MSILLGFLFSFLCTAAANAQAACTLSCANRKMRIGHLVAATLAVSLYAGFTALTARPILALILSLGATTLLWAVNRLKIAVLLEPLVFSDVYLLKHVYHHPQLYIAHAPSRSLFYAALCGVLPVLLLLIEPPNASLTPLLRCLLGIVFILPWIIFFASLSDKAPCIVNNILAGYSLGFDPTTDAARFTPLGAAFLHTLHYTRRLHEGVDDLLTGTHNTAPALKKTERMPHVLLTQAESFCDIQRFAPEISEDILPHIRRAMAQGRHGRLELDWSGAYTMRTEFSVLTGLNIRNLETFGFDPYILAAQHPISTLTHSLRECGYRSICIHPYDPTFFNRDRVMRHFGFDQFIGQEDFAEAQKNGPYVSDPSVLNTAIELLHNASEPLFIFVITMEAHGPWLPDRFGSRTNHDAPLTHYIRHLRSLDTGVRDVLQASQNLDRDMIFALYGDHVPSLDIIHQKTPPPKDTDYFIWSSHPTANAFAPKNLRPEWIGNELLSAIYDGCQPSPKKI